MGAADEEQPEVRTDADNVGSYIRKAPIRSHDVVARDLEAEVRRGSEMDLPGRASAGVKQEVALEVGDPISICGAGDAQGLAEAMNTRDKQTCDNSCNVVEQFELDPHFDYDNCSLSQPEWPYNLRPRP